MQRTRSRKRSSASLGTNAKDSSPAANSRTRRLASRRSVFTLSPGARGIDPGATTRTSSPRSSAMRTSPNPVGPASYTAVTGRSSASRNAGTTPAGSPRSRSTRNSPFTGSSTAATVCVDEHQAPQGPYSLTWSAPPIAGVSAPGPPRRPVPAHLCAGCRPILPHTPESRRSIGSNRLGRFYGGDWRIIIVILTAVATIVWLPAMYRLTPQPAKKIRENTGNTKDNGGLLGPRITAMLVLAILGIAVVSAIAFDAVAQGLHGSSKWVLFVLLAVFLLIAVVALTFLFELLYLTVGRRLLPQRQSLPV